MEQLIVWLEDELKNARDLIDVIEDQKARFYSQEYGKPKVDTTEKNLIEAKEKVAKIEAQLQRLFLAS
jgi:hypothetical protein